MFQMQTANLPPQQRQMVHADFLADEQAYLAMRANLLTQYRGQWVAIHGGKVIAAGTNLLDVLDKAAACGGHPYTALVGAEDAVVFRVRRAVFGYDQQYHAFPLPRVSATLWNHAQTHSQACADVIPDTGADISVLPDVDCQAINLFAAPYMTGVTSGVVGASVTTLFHQGKVEIDGRRYAALIQPIPAGQERLVGRDVLNQQRVLFDGPGMQVLVNP